MQKIITKNSGVIRYNRIPIYLGIKKINKEIALENLKLFQSVMISRGLNVNIIAGTLLGAVRDGDFITHDEDIDLYFLEEDKDRFLDSLPDLIKVGFDIARYEKESVLSVMKDGEYIDVYFFKKYKDGLRNCTFWIIPDTFLSNCENYEFKGLTVRAPIDKIGFLEYEYGASWKTPIQYADFNMPKWKIAISKIKQQLKDCMPQPMYEYISRKTNAAKVLKNKERAEAYINSHR